MPTSPRGTIPGTAGRPIFHADGIGGENDRQASWSCLRGDCDGDADSQIVALESLSDRELRDIGITRDQIAAWVALGARAGE